MKRAGWIVEWREEGFEINGREVDFHESRASADRAIKGEREVLLPGAVLSLHRVTIDPEPVRVVRSKARPS